MNAVPKLLVVDDESVVRESCTRILEPEGFEVVASGSSREALGRALADRYAVILLDIMLPDQDGLGFLEELRRRGSQVPVIIITGYSNVPSAAAAMRLGAADYIPKPFSPDEIIQAVRRLVPATSTASVKPAPAAEPWSPLDEEILFGDEAWLQRGRNGVVRVGVPLPRRAADELRAVRLPAVGEHVHRGLPLCALRGDREQLVAAPLSGQVVAVNEPLAKEPALAAGEPSQGWMVEIRPSALDAELRLCQARVPVLLSGDELAARRLAAELSRIGCAPRLATAESVVAELRGSRSTLLLVDAFSLGERGPALTRGVLAELPEVRVVVLATTGSSLESEYRQAGIFYYSVEPFLDGEIVEILQVAYLPPLQPERPRRSVPGLPHWVRRVSVVNARGEKVALLAARELLQEGSGIGRELIRALQRRALPIHIVLGYGELGPIEVAEVAGRHDRVVILQSEEDGRLPGSLRRGGSTPLAAALGAAASKLTVLSVAGKLEAIELRASLALAEHIVAELI